MRETAVETKTPATLLDSYRTEEGSSLLGGFLWLLGFLGSLWARLAAAEGGVQQLTALAFGGVVAAAVFGFALPRPDMAAASAGRCTRRRSDADGCCAGATSMLPPQTRKAYPRVGTCGPAEVRTPFARPVGTKPSSRSAAA